LAQFYKYFIPVIFLFLFSHTAFPQFSWIRQQTPTTKDLNKVYFIDSLNGWAAGDSGAVIHTTNGGINWVIQNTGNIHFITDIFFLNSQLGFASSIIFENFSGSQIYSTTNGGQNWNSFFFPDSNVFLYAIKFFDPLKGVLGGAPGKYYFSNDGIEGWRRATTDSTVLSFPVRCFSKNYNGLIFAGGGTNDFVGFASRSTDYGQSWTSATVGSEPVYSIFLKDSLHIYGGGGDFEFGPTFSVSTNSGITWNTTYLNGFGIIRSIYFRTDSEVWGSLGPSHQFIYSTNSGNDWSYLNTTGNAVINNIQFVNPNIGFAAGNEGAVLKYVRVTSVNEPAQLIKPETFSLSNYPNPFNPSTNISYSIPKNSFVTIKIYDISGKELSTLVNEFKNAGTYTFHYYNTSLPSGIYLYKITAGNFTETKKMILIR
jgi:photosystem II stability/assembly factor-like uncharacterized protein